MDQKTDNKPLAVNPMQGIDLPFLEQITKSLQEGVFVLDLNGCLLFINTEGERLLGWSMSELAGKNMHDTIHYQNPNGSKVPASECPVQKSILKGTTFQVKEEAFIHRDGHVIPVSFTATPIIQDGQVTYSVTTFQDLIRKKQVEQELKQASDIAWKHHDSGRSF